MENIAIDGILDNLKVQNTIKGQGREEEIFRSTKGELKLTRMFAMQ